MAIDVTSLHDRRATNRWERVSVGDMLERLIYSYPDKVAIVGWAGAYAHPEFARLTYRQANDIADRIANGLLARGLRRSDRVLLCCENSVEAFLFKIGAAKAGLVCVPLNPSFAPDVVAELLRRTEPGFAVVDADAWPRLAPAFETAGVAVDVTVTIAGQAVAGSRTVAEFVEGAPAGEPDVEIHGDDIWEILFTSGTTAMPKGAMASHSSTYFGAYSFAVSLTRGIRLECDLTLATFLPIIYHIGEHDFTFPAFLTGGTLVIGRKPVPAAIAECITREGVTALWAGSPAMLVALAATLRDDPMAYDARTLTSIVYGWGALPPGALASLKRACSDDLVVMGILGQTESGSCHRFWPDKWPQLYRATSPALNYVGVPNPLLASMVCDVDGESLAGTPGVPGEAVYRSPAITAGYYRDEQATRDAFRGGWFHSGDSCTVDADGLRIMVDRYKDIVKTGGENVSSIRVEAILSQHPAVARVAVVGLPHQVWGEAVTAVVVPAEGRHPDEAELIAFCRERLAGYETPKRVILAESLPETVGGKVLKYRLRRAHADAYLPA